MTMPCFKGAASHHNTKSTLFFCEVRNVLSEFNCNIWILHYAPNYLYVGDAHTQTALGSYKHLHNIPSCTITTQQTNMTRNSSKVSWVAAIQTNALSAPAVDAQLYVGHRCRAYSSFLTTNSHGILPSLQSYAWYKVPYTLVPLHYKG